MKRWHYRSGFTLIELLVIIAIIAILAAILFPVFAQAREKARQTACLSNMKQINTAVMMYAQDYDETLPYWTSWVLPGGGGGANDKPENYWKFHVQPYIKSGSAVRTFENNVWKGETGVWECPSIGGWMDAPGGGKTRPATASYGMSMFIAYNYAASPRHYRPGLPLAALRAPASTIFAGESGYYGRIDNPMNLRWKWYADNYKNPKVQNWERRDAHSGGSNYGFTDGHAKWMKAETAYPQEAKAAKKSALEYFAATDEDYAYLSK